MPDTPDLDPEAAAARDAERAEELPAGKPESAAARRKRLEQRATELRIAGYDYAQIARALGYKTPSAAWKAVNRVREKAIREVGSALVNLELERLDTLQRAAMTKAIAGDPRSIQASLRVMQHRARLLGLHEQQGQERIAEARDAFAVFLGAAQAAHPDPDPMPADDDEQETA